MVLCHSRLLYVEFTVSQTMEHVLAAHEHAFAAFQGCPARLMIDNLKSAVLQRVVGEAPVFNARYLDFARHWGFDISPCNLDAVDRAIQDGIAFAAYSCEYIANNLEMRARQTPEPGALHLTRRQDLLDIEIAAPDLSLYEGHGNDH